jgi:hypothetical protein
VNGWKLFQCHGSIRLYYKISNLGIIIVHGREGKCENEKRSNELTGKKWQKWT